METRTKAARREVRLTEQDNNLLIEAAGLLGITVSEFVIERAVADAEAIVAAHHTIALPEADHTRFIAALDELRPNPAFDFAARRARPLKHIR